MKITEMAYEEQPRQRLQRKGPQALSSAELLAIILQSGTKEENILQLSNRLLANGLNELSKNSIQQLRQIQGVGEAKACQIRAMFELHNRARDKSNIVNVSCARDVAEIFIPKLKNKTQEHCVAIYLNIKNNIVATETISIGTLNSTLIHPREVFSGALRHLAASVIVVHNHPSGDPSPSQEDIEMTKKLEKAGKTLHIDLLDHVIVGKTSWWNWKDSKVSQLKD